jgi:integrase
MRCASTNVAATARLKSTRVVPRGVMELEDVLAVLLAAEPIDPATALALRIAAMTGARRAELAALRWTDVRDGHLTIDSSIEIVERNGGVVELRTPPPRRRTAAGWRSTTTRSLPSTRCASRVSPTACGCRPRTRPRSARPNRMVLAPCPHDGRHRRSLASPRSNHRLAMVAIGQGHNVRMVAGRRGHANPATTLRVYAHAFAAPVRPSPPAWATSCAWAADGAKGYSPRHELRSAPKSGRRRWWYTAMTTSRPSTRRYRSA